MIFIHECDCGGRLHTDIKHVEKLQCSFCHQFFKGGQKVGGDEVQQAALRKIEEIISNGV